MTKQAFTFPLCFGGVLLLVPSCCECEDSEDCEDNNTSLTSSVSDKPAHGLE